MNGQAEVFGRSRQGAWALGRTSVEFIRDLTAGMSDEDRLTQVRWLARMMDDRFGVPGTKLRFGLDSVLGLFPGLGDVLTSAIALLIVHHAWQAGASKLALARMIGNVGLDFLVGSVPFIGDLFDFVFKANRKNQKLLERHLNRHMEKEKSVRRRLARN
jgi:hypothetical protein